MAGSIFRETGMVISLWSSNFEKKNPAIILERLSKDNIKINDVDVGCMLSEERKKGLWDGGVVSESKRR